MKAVIRSNIVGANCWAPQRFVGGRCPIIFECKLPERETCKAVKAEIIYLKSRAKSVAKSYQVKIEAIEKSAQKKIDELEAKDEI